MDGGAEIGNSGRRGLYRADQLARAAVHTLSSHLTSPVPLSVRQSWLSRARRTHSQALHPAQLRMGLAALARGERRMMPLGMLPYLLWPTRTALQARCRDRLARDLRRHLLCTVGVLYGCGTTRATRGAPSAAAGRRRSIARRPPARPRARCHPGGRPHRGSPTFPLPVRAASLLIVIIVSVDGIAEPVRQERCGG